MAGTTFGTKTSSNTPWHIEILNHFAANIYIYIKRLYHCIHNLAFSKRIYIWIIYIYKLLYHVSFLCHIVLCRHKTIQTPLFGIQKSSVSVQTRTLSINGIIYTVVISAGCDNHRHRCTRIRRYQITGSTGIRGQHSAITRHMVSFNLAWPFQHVETETKWWPFRRRHFQVHFREWQLLNFKGNCTEICPWKFN